MDSILKFHHISKEYKAEGVSFQALKDINLEISTAEFIGLSGKSGSGKTTLLNVAGLIDPPTKGELYLKNQKISELDDQTLSKIRAKEIGFIFQTFNLLPLLNAIENVEYPLTLLGYDLDEARKMALEALDIVGIKEFAHHRPSQLSGGQRQRVAIARAIVKKPSMILADEPTANLDTKTSDEVFSILKNLQKELKVTILLCSHDPDLINQTNRIIRISDGQIQNH